MSATLESTAGLVTLGRNLVVFFLEQIRDVVVGRKRGSNVCDRDTSTSRTDRQTDRRLAVATGIFQPQNRKPTTTDMRM